MMKLVLPLLLSLAVSACAGGHQPLGKISGKYRVLNAGRWTPTRDDLRGPRAPLPRVQSPALARPSARGARG